MTGFIVEFLHPANQRARLMPDITTEIPTTATKKSDIGTVPLYGFRGWVPRILRLGLTRGALRIQVSAMQADTDPPAAPAPESPAESPEENPGMTATPDCAAATLDPWEELEAEAAKWKEISLRTAAEMDNLRKRTAREREEAIRYANQRLLEELLPVIDNFEMGMQAASQDTSSMIYIGMDMVRRQLSEFLASQGVEEIPTTGKFDPNRHDAVAEEECAAGEEGRILRVTRRGFKLRDRLLRPAGVVVSKVPLPTEGGAA